MGTRPAYGFNLHNLAEVRFINNSVATAAPDARPAFIANDASSVTFDHVTADAGAGSPFDAGFQDVSG